MSARPTDDLTGVKVSSPLASTRTGAVSIAWHRGVERRVAAGRIISRHSHAVRTRSIHGVPRGRHEAAGRPPVRGRRGRPRCDRADRPARPADAVGGLQPGPAARRGHGPGHPPAGRPDLRRGGVCRSRDGPVDLRVRGPVHSLRLGGHLPPALPGGGQGRRRGPRDRLAGPLLVRRHRGDDDGDHAGCRRRRAGLGLRRRVRPGRAARRAGYPRRVRPDRGHARGPAAARRSLPLSKRGWVPFEEFARFERWG